jgi:hypothetical protein
MEWNGRKYRHLVPQQIKVEEKFQVEDYLKSLAENKDKFPVWRSVVAVNNIPTQVPITPTPTPTIPTANCTWNDQTGTWDFTTQEWSGCTTPPSPSSTPANTPTPSVTPTNGAFTEAANLYLSAVTFAGGTGITSTESGATQTLFTQLFTNGLWDKIIAIYPMLGGIAASCGINGKSPYDSNSSYRLTFNGGWTFNASGATGNGTNAYANTYMSETEEPDLRMLGAYNSLPNIGGTDLGNGTSYLVTKEAFGTRALFQFGGGSALQVAVSNGQGLYFGVRLPSFGRIYKNGVAIGTGAVGGTSWGTDQLFLAAQNSSGTPADYEANQHSFVIMTNELEMTDIPVLANIINTFQTTLNRNTY